MASSAAHPVQTLREHATALEAALSVCLAEPDKKAVHKLRTETRRIEAQIALLKLIRGLPPFRAAAGKLLKHSKKLRRAAGNVRDLDVQHKLIKEEAETITRDSDDRATLTQRFDEFLTRREHERADMAAKLLKVLRKRQAQVTGSLEELTHALKPAESRTLGGAEMIRLVEGAFRATRELRIKAPSEDDLHTIRKAAKQARYQLETAPGSPTVKRLAKSYETLQDTGGEWHDWLALAVLAAKEFGKHHHITAAFQAESEKNLRAYERLLAETRTALAAKPRTSAGGAPRKAAKPRSAQAA